MNSYSTLSMRALASLAFVYGYDLRADSYLASISSRLALTGYFFLLVSIDLIICVTDSASYLIKLCCYKTILLGIPALFSKARVSLAKTLASLLAAVPVYPINI
jgi:hypothetical protein